MGKTKNTDLKFSEVKKTAKAVHQKEKYELDDGSTITFYPSFPSTLVDAMLSEIQFIIQTKEDEVQLTDKMVYDYVLFMCVKHFTHFKTQLTADTFVEQINEMKSIMDTRVENNRTDLFALIIEELFSQKEITLVFDKLAKIMSNEMFLTKMSEKVQDELSNLELKNKDVFDNIRLRKEK